MRRPSQLTWLWWASMKITGMARYSTIWRRVTREIGDNANARTYYDKVIAAFPDSSYARNAQNRLDEITEAEQAAGATGTQEGQTAQQGQTTQQGQTARQ